VCKVPFQHILPHSSPVYDYQEKLKMTEEYKNHLRTIPCRYFNFGKGFCPFGDSCFYEHSYNKAETEQYVCDERGNWKLAKVPKLNQFIDFS